MKTHCETGVTLSVKNLLGTISPQDRQAAHRTNIHKAIVDVYSYFHKTKKVVSVVDALYALEGRRGPITGNPVKMNLIVSGSDPLAVDSACVGIMGHEARAIPHLALAQEHDLGSLNFSVEGERLEDVRRNFEMPPLLPTCRSRLASYALSHVFKKRSYLRFADKCTGCGTCALSCPVGAVALRDGRALIAEEMCIGCLVCLESCKQGALDYRMRNAHAFQAARALYQISNRI
jgi:ferredoxin